MSTLLNISNHPSQGWSPSQRAGWDHIIDLPFPSIPADAGTEEIREMALDFFSSQILPICGYTSFSLKRKEVKKALQGVTCHIMGELSFFYALIQLLLDYRAKVVVSTSARESIEIVDPQTGEVRKTSVFRFVRWREIR